MTSCLGVFFSNELEGFKEEKIIKKMGYVKNVEELRLFVKEFKLKVAYSNIEFE
jgi:hypothetical protein